MRSARRGRIWLRLAEAGTVTPTPPPEVLSTPATELRRAVELVTTNETTTPDPSSTHENRANTSGKRRENWGFLVTLRRLSGGGNDAGEDEAHQEGTRRNVGEIIQRGSIYYVRYYDGRGRRRLETTKSTDSEEAEKLLRKRLSAKDAGVSPKRRSAR